MGNVIGARVPVWFRLVALLGLLWNAFGVYAYLQHVGMFGDPLAGLSPAQVALAQTIPAWVTGTYAVAVFSGLLGALCMVLGKRFASPLLWLSLLAVLAQSVWVILISDARAVEGTVALVMPLVILCIGALLVWVAGKGAARGWLS
jgi:hypothetical protein